MEISTLRNSDGLLGMRHSAAALSWWVLLNGEVLLKTQDCNVFNKAMLSSVLVEFSADW